MIDPEKDPEGYARYLKEKEEKRKQERKQQRIQEDNELRAKSVKVSDSKDFKVGSQVVIVGLQKNPEKNGSLGTLISYVREKERWAVEFRNGSTNNFKVDNLQLVEEPAASAAAVDESGEIPTAKIYISNLSAETTTEHLIKLFGGVGMLAREPFRNAKGNTKGYPDEWPFAVKLYKPGTAGGDACVEFMERIAAKEAIRTYNGYVLGGSTITVEYAGGGAGVAGVKSRDRSRSRERLAELEKLKKKLKDEEVPACLRGVFTTAKS